MDSSRVFDDVWPLVEVGPGCPAVGLELSAVEAGLVDEFHDRAASPLSEALVAAGAALGEIDRASLAGLSDEAHHRIFCQVEKTQAALVELDSILCVGRGVGA